MNFFGGLPWKKILFFLFKVSTYVFGMGIIFLLTLLQILIWGKKVLTLCQKMYFFWQNNTFSFRNCKKKRFRLRFLKTTHILFLFTSLGQLRQHRSYFVHFQPKTKDIMSFWVFLTKKIFFYFLFLVNRNVLNGPKTAKQLSNESTSSAPSTKQFRTVNTALSEANFVQKSCLGGGNLFLFLFDFSQHTWDLWQSNVMLIILKALICIEKAEVKWLPWLRISNA